MPRQRLHEVRALAALKIESAQVQPASRAAGVTLIDLQLQRKTGAFVVGVARDGTLLQQVVPQLAFMCGDVVYLAGTGDAIARAVPYFCSDANSAQVDEIPGAASR